MSEYTYQVLRVVVAQICQTIGWHSIQSTPLELLVDILHKYLQEISRETYRHTELYGRTEPNLVDVGLAFRNLNINLSDIEEYINYVDCVGCNVDVPKFPLPKESNLNFLKPGSKEVLTRPVHIPEYLPPIYPEKEEEPIDELKKDSSSDGNSLDIISLPSSDSAVFKKPEIAENPTKKPKIFMEEEGRPTREISSVMMTSSGFISPAREGKLPDAKPPVIPEYKSPPPPPPLAVILPPSLPVGNIDSKFDKKDKKKKSNTITEKEQRKKEKSVKDSNKHAHSTNDGVSSLPEKVKPTKRQKNKKHREHVKDHNLDEIPPQSEPNSLKRNEPLPLPSSQTLLLPMDLDIKPKEDEIKLSCEPSKEKLNIFKKISTTKKERDDICRSPHIFHDVHLLSTIPEGTTITPAPPLKHQHYPLQQPNKSTIDDDQVICVDDEPGFQSELPKTLPPSLPQSLLPPGTTIKAQTPKKPRKKAQQQQQAKQVLEQNLPLNLSNVQKLLNMKKDMMAPIPPGLSLTQKPQKVKKERRKPKARESKKLFMRPRPLLPPQQNHIPSTFNDKNLSDSLLFKTSPLNQKFGKPDNVMSNNPNAFMPQNFAGVQPPIPMFPFYPFPPRPGLIPNPGLFPPLQPMPDNPAFNKFLPMMRFGNFGNMNKLARLTSTYDDEPLPLPPIDTEKSYCNVAPLVPDSMKFQLSPTRLKSNKPATTTSSEISTSISGHLGEAGPSSSKQTKISDSPIEISDDENIKSGSEDKEQNIREKSSGSNDIGGGNASNVSIKAEAQNASEDNEAGSVFNDEREEKIEKRKDKMHKKGKKEKEGKIKKKKDKKDKSKSKEKAEKKKEKDEKKDKEKARKLKKEKKKDKLRALAYCAEESKVDSTHPDSSQHSTVPKLTLKIGLGNSPQPDSPDGRKLSVKSQSDDMTDSFDDVKMMSFDRRESSPELARISPLVTRPPKQKTSTNDNFGSVMPINHTTSVENRLPQSNLGKSPTLHRHLIGVTSSDTPNASQLSDVSQTQFRFSEIYGSGTYTRSTNCDKLDNTKLDQNSEPQIHKSQHMTAPIRNNSTTSVSQLSGQRISSTLNIGVPFVPETASTTLGYRQASSSQTNTFLLSAVENNNRPSSYIDADGNQVWICPACGRVDDGTPMIGCDGCDAWYHWVCVGIQVPPDDNEDWYCRVCIAKKQEAHGADKKRKRKKKSKAN